MIQLSEISMSLKKLQLCASSNLLQVFGGSLSKSFKMITSSSSTSSEATGLSSASEESAKRNIIKQSPVTGKRKPPSKDTRNHPKKMFKSSYEERFGETDYYIDDGFRRVVPYVYAFETHAKGRWYERELLDIFKKEFRLETPEFYAKAIQTGLIKINGQRTTADYVVKSNDFLHSKVHRHEPPVTSDPIEIISKTDDFVIVNKPASIPVHPCGKYRHNTVVFLLAKEHNLTGLHTIHRLDRLTSGLLMFARTKAVSQRIDAFVRNRKLKKTYLCKVIGEFPSHHVECNEPIFIVSHKIGVCRVRSDGKPCKTTFQRISYDGETSIVKCFPETGRMHQIRVHLQYLGHPIQNDPLYNNPVWGPRRGHGGCDNLSDDELLTRLVDQHNEEKTTKINERRREIEEKNVQPTINSEEERGSTSQHQGIGIHINEEPPHQKLTSGSNEAAEGNEGNILALHKSVNTIDKTEAVEDGKCSSSSRSSSSIPGGSLSSSGPRNETSEVGDSGSVGVRAVCKQADTQDDANSNRCLEWTTMDGTLSGIGVLKVSEEKLKELAEDGSDKAVNQIAEMLCRECVTPLPDPKPEEMMIFLHALTYKGPDFEFSTPLPDWAVDHANTALEVT